MQPAVPTPGDGQVRIPIEGKLAAGWRYDADRRVFGSASGEVFKPWAQLPKRTKIVYKVPSLAQADDTELSAPERELRRYLQIILPAGHAAADFVEIVAKWPCLERSRSGPDISLPGT